MRKHAYDENNRKPLPASKHLKEKIFDEIPAPLAVIGSGCEILFTNTAFCSEIPVSPAKASCFSMCRACDAGPCTLALPLQDALAKHRAGAEAVSHYECETAGERAVLLRISDLDRTFLVMVEDVNDPAKQKRLLVSELNHKLKNALQIAKSLATQTARHSTSMESFLSAFDGRLSALAQAQTLLPNLWSPVQIQTILEQAVSLHDLDEQRVRIASSPAVEIPPQEALSLRLALHELFTNALKHGALSVAAGRVDVSWKATAGDGTRVHLLWKEMDGPKVVAPQKTGFGTEFIELLLPFDLDCKANLRFMSQGLQCELEFPLPKSGRVIWS